MSDNRWQQKNNTAAAQRRMSGIKDPQGPTGIMSRGKNIYNGVSSSAHSGGGPQYGRPRKARSVSPQPFSRGAILRRAGRG